MKRLKSNTSRTCHWANRFEVIGAILILIASIITILTFDSVGIAAMFLVGLIFCGHKHLTCRTSEACEPDCMDETVVTSHHDKAKSSRRKTTK